MVVREPKIVVAHREDLWWLLAEACQLEHMIMCQYLFAEWTLKDASDDVTAEQSEAIERWRGVLRGIASDSLSGSRLGAVGTNPSASSRSIPSGRSRNRKCLSACSPNGLRSSWMLSGK